MLIDKLVFHQILTLFDTSSISFSEIMTPVTSYFSFNTGSSERETKTTVASIKYIFFHASNLQSIDFTVPDPANCLAYLTYCTFRSIVSVVTVGDQTPEKYLSLVISLRLPWNFTYSLSKFAPNTHAASNPSLVKTSFKPVENLSFRINIFWTLSPLQLQTYSLSPRI